MTYEHELLDTNAIMTNMEITDLNSVRTVYTKAYNLIITHPKSKGIFQELAAKRIFSEIQNNGEDLTLSKMIIVVSSRLGYVPYVCSRLI